MKKLTPILTLEGIEPSLPFWVYALGFTKTVDVPHGEDLGFAILEKDGYEVMLQTVASMQADVPAVADYELLVPRRKTFYGAEEIFVREPGGNVVGFAQFGTAAEG